MILRRFLLLVPASVLLILLQSSAWVPRYGNTQNNTRLETFIEASSGDARLLNPILHADTSSSRIVDLVFDGLLKIGDDLTLKSALAKSWSIREEAYLLVDPDSDDPSGANTIGKIQSGLRLPRHQKLAQQITDIQLSPPTTRTLAALDPKDPDTAITLRLPVRIKFTLEQVLPDLLSDLHSILGDQFGDNIQREKFIKGPASPGWTAAVLKNKLPLLEHNPIIRFELRTDVRFHDGVQFDAEDVKFTYRAIMAPRNLSPIRSNFEPIKTIRILNSHRLDVVYKRLFSPAINAWTVGILPEHRLNDDQLKHQHQQRGFTSKKPFGLRDSHFNRNPVGTGAFRFVQWQSSEFIELVRNEDYWDGPPLYGRYFYRVIPDNLTQELEFRAGAADTYQVEPHQAQRYRENPDYQSFSTQIPGYTYIGYNLRNPVFSNPIVRRALGMAIDTSSIIRYVLFGEGSPTSGPYAIQSPWYNKNVPALSYDPPAALKLLNELGWQKNAQGWLERNGEILEFNLITNNGNLRRKAIATIVQRAWQRIGIKTNVQLFEWAVFLKDFINPGKFDAVVLGWRLDLDPDQYSIWHSSQTGPNQLNFIGFKNKRADYLIERIRTEYNLDAQVKLTHELHALIAEQQPYTFLFAPLGTRILDRRIVMRDSQGEVIPVHAGGAGDVFYHMNRWQKLAHDPNW